MLCICKGLRNKTYHCHLCKRLEVIALRHCGFGLYIGSLRLTETRNSVELRGSEKDSKTSIFQTGQKLAWSIRGTE
jgi:hypothetical protein